MKGGDQGIVPILQMGKKRPSDLLKVLHNQKMMLFWLKVIRV
jgi:hypothetical protein